jgi:tetratricopeptide (TPR) repeat protein
VFPRLFLSLLFLTLPVSALLRAQEPTTPPPPQARARYEQGRELEKKGQYEEAVRAYEEAIRLGMQDFPRAHLYRARANLDLKKYDDAIAQYTKFLDEFGLEKSCRY